MTKLLLLLSVLPKLTAATTGGCSAVTRDKCGTDYQHSCLRCGTSSSFDCEQCCPHCTQVTKGDYKYCQCSKGPSPGPSPPSPSPGKGDYLCYQGKCYNAPGKGTMNQSACQKTCSGPGPSPGPSPSGDSWDNYQVAGMDVISVTGGHNKSSYEKVVIMLHGGGGSGSDWRYQYNAGWFGNLTGFKYVFPTSPLAGHVWYVSFKNGCGLADDCAYNISSIQDTGSRIATLIAHEKQLVGGDKSKVFLAGFSEGAQMTGYVQLAKLDYALGGAIVMDGFPLPPLCDMPGHPQGDARKNATYYGTDMRWMIWHGDADQIFPERLTITAWNGIFDALGIRSTLKIEHIEPGMMHTLVKPEFDQMVSFIHGTNEPYRNTIDLIV